MAARPRWLDEAEETWSSLPPPPARLTAVVPIWRRPWMVLGRDTFAGDVLARLGVDHLHAGHPDRYPRIPLEELRACAPDVVVLPDEPYRFTADDGPEAFPWLALRARQRTAPDVVRAVAGRGAAGTGPGPASSSPLSSPRTVPTAAVPHAATSTAYSTTAGPA
ncbi:hypothetical protein SVIOM74S_04321 [Streptomyces violarus]